MSTEKDSSEKIPKLHSTENFLLWKFRVQLAIDDADAWEIVLGTERIPTPTALITIPATGTTLSATEIHANSAIEKSNTAARREFTKRRARAKKIIVDSLGDSQVIHVLDFASHDDAPKLMWDALTAVHQNTHSGVTSFALKIQMLETKFADGTDMAAHITALRMTNTRLASMKQSFDDSFMAFLLLFTLPASTEWQNVRTMAVESTTDEKPLNSADVEGRLLRHAAEQTLIRKKAAAVKVETALAANTTATTERRTPNCTNCRKGTHQTDTCWAPGGVMENQRPERPPRLAKPTPSKPAASAAFTRQTTPHPDSDTTYCFNTSVRPFPKPSISAQLVDRILNLSSEHVFEVLIIDSGASETMTPRADWFVPGTYQALPEATDVQLGNGKPIDAIGRGSISLWMTLETGRIRAIIPNVLHVPELATTLVSVAALTNTGHELHFKAKQCNISSKSGQLVGVAVRGSSSLYILQARPITSDATALVTTASGTSVDINRLHRRLGHLGYDNVRRLVNKHMVGDITTLTGKQEFCDACQKAKSHRHPFDNEKTTAEHPLDLIHSDVAGPLPESLGGARYFVTFIDDHTRMFFIDFLKTKDEVFSAFKKFKARVELSVARRIKILRSDNGGEYISDEFKAFLAEHGIQSQFSTPHTPESNGLAERANRTIKERTMAMLQGAGMTTGFWAEASDTAVYNINLSPATGLINKTPFEAWHGRKPVISRLRTFGSVCYAHIPTKTRKALEPKSRRCRLLGYSAESKAYKVWDPAGHRIIRTRDVVFNEDRLTHGTADDDEFQSVYEDSDTMSSSDGDPPPPMIDIVGNQTNSERTIPNANAEIPVSDEITQGRPKRNTRAPLAAYRNTDWKAKQKDDQAKLDASNAAKRTERARVADDPRIEEIPDEDMIPSEEEEEGLPTAMTAFALKSAIRRMEESFAAEDRTLGNIHALAAFNLVQPDTPKSVKAAFSSSDEEKWRAAVRTEYDGMVEQKVFTKVHISDIPLGRKPIGSKIVLATKRDEKGDEIKKKARIVAKGYAQVEGVDVHDTYAPVTRMESIRIICAIAAAHNLELDQMDVKTAFLNSDIDELVFITPPDGIPSQGEGIVWKLNKGLYGLRQSSKLWFDTIDGQLGKLGWERCEGDNCLYIYDHDGAFMLLALYVDDLLLACPIKDRPVLDDMKLKLKDIYEMTDLGVARHLLGLEIIRDRAARTLCLSQQAYIDTIVDTYGQSDAQALTTPMSSGHPLSKDQSPKNDDERHDASKLPYQNLVGSLMYAARATRPDICYAIGVLSKFSSCYGRAHWAAAIRVVRYLKGTRNLVLRYDGKIKPSLAGAVGMSPDFMTPNLLEGFTDSDWAGDADTRKSTSGYVFMLSGGAISWSSRLQPTVALSSTEAEYMGGTRVAQEAMFLRPLLSEILRTEPSLPTTIHCDNQGAIALSVHPGNHPRTKHIELKYHFIRQAVNEKKITLKWCKTDDMVADIMTKGLDFKKHSRFRSMMGLVPR